MEKKSNKEQTAEPYLTLPGSNSSWETGVASCERNERQKKKMSNGTGREIKREQHRKGQ